VADAVEERKVVSLLFADLVGSTSMGEQLDPEDLRQTQRDLYSLLAEQVERFGGTMEKFVGDAALAVFGIPQAHEDDAERAVRAALAMRDAFPAFARILADRHGVSSGVRIGVNTGEVVASREAAARGELMVSGDAVNTAARLQQGAEPGEILAGERTVRSTAGAVRYGPPRHLDARGKANGVVVRPALEAHPEAAVERHPRLAAPLVGRDDELALLGALAARARRERSAQLVTLFGVAGIGKSRLLAEFVAGLDDATYLHGRCLSYGDGVTYWPLAEIAKAQAGILESDDAATAHDKLAASVAAVVPPDAREQVSAALALTLGLGVEAGPTGGFGGRDVGAALVNGWSQWLAGVARDGRLAVLAIEDVHWASQPLVELLPRLLDRLDDVPILMLCTARPELLDGHPSWGGGRRDATALTLRPLDTDDALHLVEALLEDGSAARHLRDRILERSEGNPFFTEELLWMLIEQGVVVRDDGRWLVRGELAAHRIPDSIQGVLAARIDLLGARERRTLRECAVVGRTFWAEAIEADEEVIEGLCVRDLVVEHPTSAFAGRREFAFKHALVGDVAYSGLPRTSRRGLHLRVGRWIERIAAERESEVAELVAHHYRRAVENGDERPETRHLAAEHLLQAGEVALARAAIPSARATLEAGLSMVDDDAVLRSRIELALAQVSALDAGGDGIELLRHAAARVGPLDEPELLAEIQSWLSRMFWFDGRMDDARAAVDGAIEALAGRPEGAALARARARRSQLLMLANDPDAGVCAEEAVATARRVGDVFAEVNAAINLATVQGYESHGSGSRLLLEARDLAIDAGIYEEFVRATINFVWTAWTDTPLDELERGLSERSVTPWPDVTSTYEDYLSASLARFVLVPAARWAEADRLLARPRMLTVGTNRLVTLELKVRMALARGAEDTGLDALVELADKAGEAQRILPARVLAAHAAAIDDDAASARHHLEAATTSLFEGGHNPLILELAAEAGRVMRRAGAPDEVSALWARLRPEAERYRVRVGRGIVALGDGLALLAADEGREAVAPLERARNVARDRGATYEAARVELELADAHTLAGDDSAAAHARVRAARVLDPLGCVEPV
jgi:class 3 adenylate cyclase